MKALQFPLFCLLASAESFHIAAPSVIPYLPKPDYVCVTFPFCYQQLGTGAWKSMFGTSQINNTESSSLPRDVRVESSECWLDGYYCRSDASNLITRIKLDSAEECQQKCVEEESCQFFSFHDTRGQGYCSLLSECVVKRKCSDSENCATGGKTCNCQKLDYFPGNKESSEYSRWNCGGELNPYTTEIPVGTTCSATCPAWKDSTLQSTCLRNGKWSGTAPAARRSLGYAASYPTPDLPDMECGCNEVGTFNYDPNTETGAHFVCDGKNEDEYKKAGGWTIKNTDKCELFCSDAPEPVVSVYCDAATWKGQPELGFWCYDKPENPGPQVENEGPVWRKVYSLNTAGGLFANLDETKKKNIDNPEANLFSILYDLESMRNAEGVFHFKLCYPELAEDFPCNEWTQSSNPLTQQTITGFEGITVTWNSNGNNGPFEGLGLSTPSFRWNLIDTAPDIGNWWFSIGTLKHHAGPDTVPGPYPTVVKKVELSVFYNPHG